MTSTRQDDHHTKARIVEELEWTADVNADRIGVAVNEGGVTLSGQVPSYPENVPVQWALVVGVALAYLGATEIDKAVQHRTAALAAGTP